MSEGPQPTVLVIDDSELVLELFAALLEDDGWRVETRTTPFLQADDLLAISPDVVLLDLGIPGVEDRDLPYLVTSLRAGADRKILLNSGRSDEELRQIAEACAADGYLCKGSDEMVMLDLLAAHRNALLAARG